MEHLLVVLYILTIAGTFLLEYGYICQPENRSYAVRVTFFMAVCIAGAGDVSQSVLGRIEVPAVAGYWIGSGIAMVWWWYGL